MNFIRTCAGSSICTYFNNLKYAKDKLRTCTYHYIAVAVSINMYNAWILPKAVSLYSHTWI
jgi:hypothetical protein